MKRLRTERLQAVRRGWLTDLEDFGFSVLRYQRENDPHLRLTQQQMADRIGVKQYHISRIERGANPGNPGAAEMYAFHYCLTPEQKAKWFKLLGIDSLNNAFEFMQLPGLPLDIGKASSTDVFALPPHPDFSRQARAILAEMEAAEEQGNLDICNELFHNWYMVLDAAGQWDVFSVDGLGYRVAQRLIAKSQWELLYEYFYPALRSHLEQHKWADMLTLIEKLGEVAQESRNNGLRGLCLLGLAQYTHEYYHLEGTTNASQLRESLLLLREAQPLLQDLPECLAHCINLRGNVHRSLNEAALAAEAYGEGRVLTKHTDFVGKSRMWRAILKINQEGMIQLDIGDWEKALNVLLCYLPSLPELVDIAEVFIAGSLALWKLGYKQAALVWFTYGKQLASELRTGQPICIEQKRLLEERAS